MCASADKSHQVLEEKIKRVLQNCVAKLIGNAISVALIVKEPCPNVNTGYIYGGYGELLDMLDMRIPLSVPDNAQKINIFDDLEDVSVECSPFKKQRGTMAGSCVGSTQLPEQIVSSHARVINRDSLTQETEPQHHIKVGQTTGPGLEMEVFEDTQPDHDAVVIKKEVPDDFPEEILPKQQKSMFVSSSVKNINSQSDATARSIRDRTQTGSEEDDPCTDAESFIGDETGSETVASVTMATRTETRVPPLVSAKEEVYDDDRFHTRGRSDTDEFPTDLVTETYHGSDSDTEYIPQNGKKKRKIDQDVIARRREKDKLRKRRSRKRMSPEVRAHCKEQSKMRMRAYRQRLTDNDLRTYQSPSYLQSKKSKLRIKWKMQKRAELTPTEKTEQAKKSLMKKIQALSPTEFAEMLTQATPATKKELERRGFITSPKSANKNKAQLFV